jgi:tetratricopeptide (TPR) repeat protein
MTTDRADQSSDSPTSTAAHAPAAPPTARRRRWFALIAVLLPILFVLMLEGGLRLAGFGGYPPVFKEIGPAEGGVLMATNQPGAASYFYTRRSRPGSLNESTFLTPKPANTVRVMLFGGSAIKGFPQPMGFTSATFLEAMLRDLWPDKNIEVINLGTTAIGSFPMYEMVRAGVAYDPDLVVIYSGHNEYFGAYGVASLHSAGRTPVGLRFFRWFRSTGISQAAERIGKGGSEAKGKTLMEAVARGISIGADDPSRAAAAENLYTHTKAAIDACHERGIPVMVCTLPSNERDLAPLGHQNLDHLSEAERKQLTAALTIAEAKLGFGSDTEQPTPALDPAGSVAELATVFRLEPNHARAHFLQGRADLELGSIPAAAQHFERAINLDPMPWRAPSGSVDAVRQAAADTGAILCDVQAAFREASPDGCIGWELMDDHVHPSLLGQDLIARTIVATLPQLDGDLHVSPATLDALPTPQAYAHRLGDNRYTRFGVAHSLAILCNASFYRETNPQAFARFARLERELEAALPGYARETALQWQSPDVHVGAKRPITGMVGRALVTQGRFAEAVDLFPPARRGVPSLSSWYLEYAYFELACQERIQGKLDEEAQALAREAIQRGELLLRFSESHTGLTERYAGRLHQMLGEHAEAIPLLEEAARKLDGTDLVAAHQALVQSYLATGQVDTARELIQVRIDNGGEYAPYYRRMLELLPTE